MPKANRSDNFLFCVIGALLAVAVLGAILFRVYFQPDQHLMPQISYSAFEPIMVRTSTFSIKAKIVVQTSDENVDWVRGSWTQLDTAMKAAMAGVDPARVRSPDGLVYVQNTLRDAANSRLHTANIQQVLLVDFIIQDN